MRLGNMKCVTVILIAPFLLGLTVAAATGVSAEREGGLQAALVEWASSESVERLSRSSHKADFFPLSNHFISQDNSIFCGPVSSAIVLNALRLGKREQLPRDRSSIAEDEMAWLWPDADPFYGKYTPNNVLTERTKTRFEVLGKPILVDGETKRDYGLQLRQLAQVLRSHGLEVVTRVVGPGADVSVIRREIAANLAAGEDFVLVNYARRALGQEGGGHISPLGAYDVVERFVSDHGREPQSRAVGVGRGGGPDCGDADVRYGREPRLSPGVRRGIGKPEGAS